MAIFESIVSKKGGVGVQIENGSNTLKIRL